TLRAAYATLAETYDPENVNALDAFSLPDELVGPTFLPVPDSPSVPDSKSSFGEEGTGRNACPTLDYRRALQLFPKPQLARRIFGTLENCRIDRQLRRKYRGLARDLDLIREHLRRGRLRITQLPAQMVPFELLFQSTLLGGA